MEKNKILILGSDFGTIEVVKEAHRRGLFVIVADLMETSPTKQLADESWLISTNDIDLLEKKCLESNITAIMFGASDFNIGNCRELCKRLGLPIFCDDDYACKVSKNKRLFKDICSKNDVKVSKDFYLTDDLCDEDLDKVVFPVVVKPSDKSGNRGMSFCNSKEDLILAYKKAREISDEKIIIEKQLFGNEYNIHYALADGESTLLYFSSTHHEPGQLSNLYSFKCTTSEHLKQFIDEVDFNLKKVFREIGCKDGIVWVDAIRDLDGHFYILEMGFRFGGVMTYIPYKYVSGFNTIGWMLDCALGIKHKKEDLPVMKFPYTSLAASYHLFTCREGTINSIEGLEALSNYEGIFIDMPKRVGNDVRLNACMGLVGIFGENINDLCNKLKFINDNLSVKDLYDNNMFIYFDDYDGLIKEYNAGFN